MVGAMICFFAAMFQVFWAQHHPEVAVMCYIFAVMLMVYGAFCVASENNRR